MTRKPVTIPYVEGGSLLRSRIGAHIDRTTPWDDWNGSTWNPRHRPALHTAADLVRHLSPWLRAQGIACDDIPPETVFLAEYANTDVPRPSAMP